MSGVIYRLTGTEQARRCIAAAREASTWSEVEAWERLARRYMRQISVQRTEASFGDDDFGEELRAHVGA